MVTDFERKMKERARLNRESSMLNWYPKIKDHLPTPRTEILVLSDEEIDQIQSSALNAMDGISVEIPLSLVEKIRSAADRIGYPLFMRTDQASGKHEWKDTCYVKQPEDLIKHVQNLVVWHCLVDMVGLPWSALMFREFLELNAEFAAFLDMPVARERRYFVFRGKVVCHHHYWVKEAIRFYGRNVEPGWEEILAKLNEETPQEIETLTRYSETFSKLVPGFWSVDFAEGKDGTWWMIDAARGEASWHPKDCPNAPQREEI